MKIGASLLSVAAVAVLLSSSTCMLDTESVQALTEPTSEVVEPLYTYQSFQSYNFPTRYIRHSGFLGELTPLTSTLDKLDGTFNIIHGLANPGCVSFESKNFPGYFLRHEDSRLKLHPYSSTALYKSDATFCIRPGLADPSWVSFESYNYPGYHIRHSYFHLYIAQGSGWLYNADTTFRIVNPIP